MTAFRRFVVARVHGRAELAQLALAARVELEQLVPEARAASARLGANGRRAHEVRGAIPRAVDRANRCLRDGGVRLPAREPEEERELDEHERREHERRDPVRRGSPA